ncbi:MAG: ABC transporter ATP-binding protein [Methanobacteriota archaeon]|nr:MAG: ABC transporter ATP-binding protein [Euryarchaeota archaeon]
MNVLYAQNLRKIYPNGVEAVRNLNLSVKKGEVFGFLGPNGAGKTTCIKMFTGLTKPTSGNLEVLGYALPDQWQLIRGDVGYVPQDLVFYEHLSIAENFRLFATCLDLHKPKERIDELSSLFGLDELMQRRAGQLSGGQKRRLNVALGFLSSPELLILDEPSAGMDPQSRAMLWKSLEEIRRKEGVTIILTTHLMETADRLSDRVAIINQGEVVAVDSPDTLKKKYSKGEVIEISLSPKHVPMVRKAAATHEDWLVSTFGGSISISLANALDGLPDVFEIMEQTVGRQQIQSLSIRSNTLEDVFLTLTGRKLEDENNA